MHLYIIFLLIIMELVSRAHQRFHYGGAIGWLAWPGKAPPVCCAPQTLPSWSLATYFTQWNTSNHTVDKSNHMVLVSSRRKIDSVMWGKIPSLTIAEKVANFDSTSVFNLIVVENLSKFELTSAISVCLCVIFRVCIWDFDIHVPGLSIYSVSEILILLQGSLRYL